MKAWLYRPHSVATRRVMVQLHLWIGLLAGLYVFVVCVTGAALVFRIDIQRAVHPHLFSTSAGAAADAATILESVRNTFPADGISFVEAPSRTRPTYLAYLRRGDAYPAVLVDPVSARVLGEIPERSWVRTLQELHFDLLGGRTGRLVNGAGAALLLALCLTGVLIWWPGIRNWRRGFSVAWRRQWKRVAWELHGVTGICAVAVIAMWAVTGLYFAFPAQYRAFVNWMSPLTVAAAPSSGPARPADAPPTWRQLVARAEQQRPGEYVARIVPPADEHAAFLVMFSPVMPLPAGRAELTPVYLDQHTGSVLQAPPVSRSAGDSIMEWSAWLHVGGFGGNGVRIAWFVLGFAPPLLFVTGFVSWWGRVKARSQTTAGVAAISGEGRESQGASTRRGGVGRPGNLRRASGTAGSVKRR